MSVIEISEPGISGDLEDNNIVVGIDFGTTNSLIAISSNYQARIIQDQNKRELIPSIVDWDKLGNLSVPMETIKNSIDCLNYICSIKRLLGKSKEEILASPILNQLVGDLIDKTSSIPKLRIKDQIYTVSQIAAEIFKYLKIQAENALGMEVKRAVVSIPAYFDDAARGEVMLAAKLGGFEVLRLIAEPTSAAYAYGLNKKNTGGYLVYDFGGGTFDISLLNMKEGVLQVIATNGDNMLGGDDIDYLIAKHFQEKCGENIPKLIEISRAAKEFLTYNNNFTLKLRNAQFNLSTEIFEELIAPLIKKTINLTKDTLEQASNFQLERIILVGGSTRIPLVKKLLNANFNVPIFSDIDPDKVVAIGAALQGENLTSSHNNTVLIDVLPLSLGLELHGGIVEKIILRNSPIPLSITKEFTTYVDNQTAMKFHILQGEREMVKDCRSLAHFELKELPIMKAGGIRIEVTFSIDADGILSVSALEKTTSKSQIITIKPTYGMSEEEINNMLENAYRNASEDHEERLLQEIIIETKSLIHNINSSIKEMPDLMPIEERNKINEKITTLEKLLTSKDRALIKIKMQELEKLTEKFLNLKLNHTIGTLLNGKRINEL